MYVLRRVRQGRLGKVTEWSLKVSKVLKQYSTVQYSAVQCSTVQYSAVQYSTVQYSTVQYEDTTTVRACPDTR